MKERPILMTPENAQKVFEGTKTQTRRIIKPQPNVVHGWNGEYLVTNQIFRDGRPGLKCPYGIVGDRLWIREAWGMSYIDIVPTDRPFIEGGTWGSPSRPNRRQCVVFKAHGAMPDNSPLETARWRPSIHMPRWACRSVVEMTEVRVERVQDISEEDARAEGCGYIQTVAEFATLWTSIHGPDAWKRNDWVFVLTFKRL